MGKVKIMASRLSSGEVCVNPKKHRFFRFLVGAAVLVIAVFIVYTLVSDMIKINQDTEKYNSLVNQTKAVNEQNAQIENYLENDENMKEYIEEIAREKLDYAYPDERIYNVIPAAEE